MRNGLGVYKWANGSTYEGNFFNDTFYGPGKLTTIDGKVFEGNWLYGEPFGDLEKKIAEANIDMNNYYPMPAHMAIVVMNKIKSVNPDKNTPMLSRPSNNFWKVLTEACLVFSRKNEE
mmetsp:Transcript_19898/g.17016  ORF Transcript_19898/g.17016 Transcript_19898/m.17016 type:complete len:118 (+) Transcript_19898:152-505(+)